MQSINQLPPTGQELGTVLERENHGFECLGECSTRIQFHSRGILQTGEVDKLFCPQLKSPFKHSFVKLFGQLYDIELSKSDLKRLFSYARHRLCMLDSYAKTNTKRNISSGGLLNNSNPSSSNLAFLNLRTELRQFYLMLRNLVVIEGSDSDSAWIVQELLPTIIQGLTLLRLQLGWLTNLPDWVLNCSGSGHKAEGSAPFHLFHCHLELRWLHISVHLAISQLPNNLKDYQSFNSIQSSIRLCIWDLMQMALLRFSKLPEDQIACKSFYKCVCVKELWFLIKLVYEKTEDIEDQPFWKVLNHILESIIPQELNHSTNIKGGSLEMPSKLYSTQPILSSVWTLKHLAELFIYDSVLPFTLRQTTAEENHDALKRILKSLTDSSVSRSESQLRALLTLVKALMTDIWSPKTDPIMMLWDYCFYRLLDSAFQLTGASAASYAVPCETPQDIFTSVTNILGAKSMKGNGINSYDIFLSLLGSCLINNPSQWKQKMRGRIYSKLSAKKIDDLSEMGLYHLAQLFLTIALTTDPEDVRERFQTLFSLKTGEGKKNEMILKAHLSFLLCLSEKGMSLSPILTPIVAFISTCVEEGKLNFPRIFASCMENVLVERSAVNDHHIFVGKWVNKYLLHYHPDSGRNLLCALLSIMSNLEKQLDDNGGVIDECVGLLLSALWENLLPYVTKQMEGSSAFLRVADLAVSFTLLCLHLSGSPMFTQRMYSFQNLMDQFLMMDSLSLVNVTTIRRYLSLFVTHNKAKVVIEDSLEVQLVLAKAWVRCSAMSNDFANEEFKIITKNIFEFSHMQSITESSLSMLKELAVSSDPLCSLFENLGNRISHIKDRKGICKLLQPLERLARVYQQHLFPSKPKDESNKLEKRVAKELPKELVMRGYHVFASLVFNCGSIVYQKGTATSLLPQLVSTALLPNAVFDASYRLPLALNDALKKCLLPFLRGLYKLDPGKDSCINRYMGDIVKHYLPRMVMETGPSDNPFVHIYDEPEYMDVANYILTTMCSTFLQVEKTVHYVQCLKVLQELMKNGFDEFILCVLIQSAFPRMLDVMGKLTDTAARAKCKEVTEKTLKQIFNSDVYLLNPSLWEETNNVLKALSKKYFIHNIDIFTRIISVLKCFQHILKCILPILNEQIEAERRKGSNVDKLQAFYEKFKKALNSGSYQN